MSGYDWQVPFTAHMSDQEYFADPCPQGSLSASGMKLLAQPGGPALFAWRRTHPEPPKQAFDFGHAAHKLALGEGPEIQVIDGDRRTKAVRDQVEEARAAGLTPLKPEEADRVHAMADALVDHPAAAELLTAPGVSELACFHRDGQSGVWLRSKLDRVVEGAGVVDYKSAVSADPDYFSRHVYDYGYDIQAAVYLAQAAACLPDLPQQFWFLVQEKAEPYRASLVELDADWLRIGRARMRDAIDTYTACTESGDWPGYPPEPVLVSPPPWVSRRFTDTTTEDWPGTPGGDADGLLAALEGLMQ